MSKRFLIILLFCVLGLVGVYTLTSKKDSGTGSSNTNNTNLSNHVKGENKKNVSFVEYGDFQCPYCGQYYPIINEVFEKYKTDIQLQFRNFPLQQHPNARAAARAAEASDMQGKYWEMFDMLYEQQKSWESSTAASSIFENYAQQLGLDIAKYKTDFASAEVNDIINADYNEGVKVGVDSTPSFFLQGKKLDPAPKSVEEFSKVIDEAIKNAQ